MEVITMADVISLLGLPGPKDGRVSYNIQCPCCDENPRKKHLNINLEKMCSDAPDAVFPAACSIYMRIIPVLIGERPGKRCLQGSISRIQIPM